MWSSLLIGLRNLTRRRFRSLMTVLMIWLGTAAIVFSVGLAEGTYGHMTDLATRTFSGHFQVVARGYQDKPSLFKSVPDPDSVIRELREKPGVTGLTLRVEAAGLVSAGNRTVGVQLMGVEPQGEPRVTTLSSQVGQGRWFSPGPEPEGDWPIILGSGVARRLRIGLGAQVSFVTQAADGSMAAELFTVVGILESGSEEMDSGLVLIRLDQAQEMLVLGKRVHRVVGLVRDLDQLPSLVGSTALPDGLELLTWAQVLPELEQTISTDRLGLYVTLVIILAVVILGVTNTMMMTVLERTREFGVMLALGTSPARLLAVILGEAGWLTAIGVCFGVALGAFLNYLTTFYGIPVGSEPIDYGGVVISEMTATNGWTGNLYFPLLILLSGLAAGVFPALRAARMKPAVALRTE